MSSCATTLKLTTAGIAKRTMDSGSACFSFYSPEHSVFAKLMQNDEDFTNLQLWLNSSSQIPELIDAIWENTSVEEVCLLVHQSFLDQPEHEILLLFAILGRLPHLTKLFFNIYRFPLNCTLPFRAFTNVFRSTRRLVEFKLWRTELKLSYNDDNLSAKEQIKDWAKALSSSRCLKEFRLIKCRLTEDLLDPDGDIALLDPLLEALSQITTLKDVELSAIKPLALGSLSKHALKKFLQSASVESFSLCNLQLCEEGVVAIAQGLLPTYEQNSTINFYQSTSNLQTLSRVKHLRITGAGSCVASFPKSIRESFRTVLQSNFRLESLHVFDSRNLQQDISFYLKLNRFGRSRLMLEHHGSKQEWVETLIQVTDDLDCLFYFLTINPLLCCDAAFNFR